jgi:hypothetical protein
VVAFKKGGMVKYTDFESARVMAVRLVLEDKDGKDVGIHFMPAYAPQGDAPQAEWDNFFADLSACADRRVKGDVIMLSADINGAIGNNNKGGAPCCGKWGNPRVNASGERWKRYLLERQMVAVGTWFLKKQGGYGTWIHPRTKKLYQHDHFFMLREDMKRVTDCGRDTKMWLDSDHWAIKCVLRVKPKLEKRQPAKLRSKLIAADVGLLVGDDPGTNHRKVLACARVKETMHAAGLGGHRRTGSTCARALGEQRCKVSEAMECKSHSWRRWVRHCTSQGNR